MPTDAPAQQALTFALGLVGSDSYRSRKGRHCSNLLSLLRADLKERGLGPLRSERKLQELRRLAMNKTRYLKSHIQNLPRTPADQGWLKPLSHIQNLPPNTSRPRLAEAPVTHSEPSPEHQPTKSHGLYPFRPEDRRGETLSEYPEYDDGLSDSDWAAMLLEKERPERRGSVDLDWFPRVSDSSPPPLNLKDLVLGKPNFTQPWLGVGREQGRLVFGQSRRFWNTPMGSGNKAGQPMALNLQTNAGRLPLGDLMKVRIKRTHGPADVADRWQFQADARGKAIKGGA
ncbi:hypothetical protein Bbelb_398770 [Branchiostoma belcheri]|nr:hypothetical protein Bbelb_398770 [Branchiostoma belcheri]